MPVLVAWQARTTPVEGAVLEVPLPGVSSTATHMCNRMLRISTACPHTPIPRALLHADTSLLLTFAMLCCAVLGTVRAYAAPAGAAQCNVCLPGSFAASTKSSVCQECPRGTFQNKYGQEQCTPCKEGTYQDARAASKCKVCPAGTFNPEKGSVSLQSCR